MCEEGHNSVVPSEKRSLPLDEFIFNMLAKSGRGIVHSIQTLTMSEFRSRL